MASQKPKTTQQPLNRREVLRSGLESLVQQRELQRRSQTNTNSRKDLPSQRKTAETIKVLGLYGTQYFTRHRERLITCY